MYHKIRYFLLVFLIFISISPISYAKEGICPVNDRSCIIDQMLENATMAITNPYKKTQAMQYMLDAQKPRDVKH